ncbi:MAG TPA: beta-galactosidase [bacterium]
MNRHLSESLFVSVILCIFQPTTQSSMAQMPDEVVSIDIRAKPVVRGQLKLGGRGATGDSISFTNKYMEWNGAPIIPVMGEFHYIRYPNAYWEESLRKMKAGGIGIVASYVFWNVHEKSEGTFDWSGDNDLRRFVRLCAKNGLLFIVRIGPFGHGEIRNGGIPDWIFSKPIEIRSNDPRYLFYAERFYRQISVQLEGLLFKQGGPVIGVQIENEYQHSASPWALTYPGQPNDYTSSARDRDMMQPGVTTVGGDNPYADLGNDHMRVLKQLAIRAGLDVPIYTATGWGNAAVIENESLPVGAAYAYPTWAPVSCSPFTLFKDLRQNPDYPPARYKTSDYPVISAELSGGIMVKYDRRPRVPAKSLEALVVRALGSGANGIGTYMFHGGSTPQENGLFYSDEAYAYPKVNYDFQAPLGEYGDFRESFHRLKLLHWFMRDFGNLLAPMDVVLPESQALLRPQSADSLRYAIRVKDGSGFVFMNHFQDHAETRDIPNVQIRLRNGIKILKIPESTRFTMKSGESAILPFNLDLNGIRLIYATAQPLSILRRGQDAYFLFFMPEGIAAEFCIADLPGLRISAPGWRIRKDSGRLFIHSPSEAASGFECAMNGGRKITVLVVSKSMAMAFWKPEIGGKECWVFSEAAVISSSGGLECTITGKNVFTLSVFPKTKKALSIPGASVRRSDGRWLTSYTVILPPRVLSVPWSRFLEDRLLVRLPGRLPDGVNDLFLRIRYVGDTGMAFLNGRLIADHFYNGEPWKLGLKRFLGVNRNDSLYFYFRPLYPDAPFYQDFDPRHIPDFTNRRTVLKMDSVETVPEYKAALSFE